MTNDKKNNQVSIDLKADERLQTLEWHVQRLAWGLWCCIIAAAVLGFLGPGLLSQKRSKAADGSLVVTFDRFVHFHHPTVLDIAVEVGSEDAAEFRVSVNKRLLDSIDIHRIDPEPNQSTVTAEGVVYEFGKEPRLKLGRLTFHLDYERPGQVHGEIALVGHAPATVSQFVFP